ncbi:unnamed protein product [Toxocara canis]|uniref:PABS domain-containing protein n=1 Tax=Toxocara canis TaxID=6265 RepID=A0A183UB66_TOXCA|nr:unnamed protein product [Toxocara canis]
MLPLKDGSPGSGTKGCSLIGCVNRMVRRFAHRQQPLDLFALFKLLVLIGAAATGLLYYMSLDWPVIIEDSKYGILGRVDESRVTLDRMCSKTTNTCFVIFDSIDFQTNRAVRNLAIEGFGETVDAMVRLIPPKGVKASESDTRIWAVDHGAVPTSYANVMAVAAFVTSSLDFVEGPELEAKVLCIGLGGGSVDMFLASKFPKMQVTSVEVEPVVVTLARKWFCIDERKNHQVLTLNGVQYLMDSEERFDVVLIDACGVDLVLPCPTADFLDETLIATLSGRTLQPAGWYVSRQYPGAVVCRQKDRRCMFLILKLFKRNFANCMTVSLEEGNLVLICFNKEPPFKEPSKLHERFYDIWRQLEEGHAPTIKRIALYL